MIARRIQDRIEIKFTYSPALISFVKNLPGRQYHAGSKSWSVPLAGSMPIINLLTERGFTVEPDLIEAVMKDAENAKKAIELTFLADTEFKSPLPLAGYQKVAAKFILQVGSGVIGDEMGLGKTIESLAVAEAMQAEKVLIFTPSSVKWQWKDEIEKFITSNKKTVVIHGTPKKRAQLWADNSQRFFVANYEQIANDIEHMSSRKWDLIIADEATKITNPQAKMSKLIKKIPSYRRIAMTGTPISNRADEVWNIFDFVNPGSMGRYYDFMARYCVKDFWGAVRGYQRMDELSIKLKRYMIRRRLADVMKELPAKIVTDIPFDLSPKEMDVYRKIKKEILYELKKEDISKLANPMTIQYTLVKMTRLRQIADSLELIGENEKSSKMEVLKDILSTANVNNSGDNGDNRKAIVFTQFSEMADILMRELEEYNPLLISGKVAGKYAETVDKFNKEEKHRVLIMTSAGQFGLNIQRASIIVHYDQEWSLAKMKQRDGRAHRRGQTRGVMVYNLLARGTIDYYVKKVLHGKGELSDRVLGEGNPTMDEIQDMLNYEGD